MAQFKLTSPEGEVYHLTAPGDATDGELIAQIEAGATPQPTAFERTDPDVAASKRAERVATLGRIGEVGARTARDAALLAMVTLLTRKAGGGQALQALSRIGTSGGIGAAAADPDERLRRGIMTGAGSGTLEALVGIPGAARVLMQATSRNLLGPLAGMLSRGGGAKVANTGAGIGTGL